jgi:hypothetical protein
LKLSCLFLSSAHLSQVGKNHAFLGDPNLACALYRAAAVEHPGWLQRSPHLASNLGICAVRDAFAAASPPSHAANTREAKQHQADAAQHFRHAVRLGRSGKHAPAFESEEGGRVGGRGVLWQKQEVATVEMNLAKFEAWQANGGEFQGALMW